MRGAVRKEIPSIITPVITKGSIPQYPEFAQLSLEFQEEIQSILAHAIDGVSEYTFANLYLFREVYHYHVSILPDRNLMVSGEQHGKRFFMTPIKAPAHAVLEELFSCHDYWKGIPESVLMPNRELFENLGIEIIGDRDNFDYLYLRTDLAELTGKKYHKKRNLINTFVNAYKCEARPLSIESIPHAVAVLDRWRTDKGSDADYQACRRALGLFTQLGLDGRIYYVEGKPAGWCLGEGLAQGRIYAVHLEKGIDEYKGIYQFMNQDFAASLAESFIYVNREQDLGDKGLRQAKMTYRPYGFVRKYIGRTI